MDSILNGEGAAPPEDEGAVPGEGGAVPSGAGATAESAGVVPAEGDAVSGAVAAARARRRLITGIKESLRAMGTQLSLLNHQVGARIELKDVDLNCLDLLARDGPLSPTALARRAGLHPATMTGILDRLER